MTRAVMRIFTLRGELQRGVFIFQNGFLEREKKKHVCSVRKTPEDNDDANERERRLKKKEFVC